MDLTTPYVLSWQMKHKRPKQWNTAFVSSFVSTSSASSFQSNCSLLHRRFTRKHLLCPVKKQRNDQQVKRQTVRAIDNEALPFVSEALELLGATTLVVPLFKRFRLSPILGFLFVGVILGPHGFRLVKDVEDIAELAEFGVLFLLFEMGLQLSLDRLRKLRKYVFGLGTLQVFSTSTVLALVSYFLGASFAESVVIGTALSLSSSAFVLQVLAEKGERRSRAGVAATGMLLLQDIATAPLLVLLPLLTTHVSLEPHQMGEALTSGVRHVAQTLSVLNVLVLVGGFTLRRVFTFVAESKSSEAFTSSVLLTVLGTALLMTELGLPMTLGSFIAGVLLAESSFRSRIMVDMEPFRGLLLGLFFITTGSSMDAGLFIHRPLEMLILILGLLTSKTILTTLSGLSFGLSLAETLRVGLVTSQGGEFSFVMFALANKLGFLPDDVNAYLTTTVVASMALTPLLYEIGLRLTPVVDDVMKGIGGKTTPEVVLNDVGESDEAFCLIFGYGPVGEVVARMLARKFVKFAAVDLDLNIVQKARKQNVPVVYGDSLHPVELLESMQLPTPSSFVITFSDEELAEECLNAVKSAFPRVPVYVRAKDIKEQKKFLNLGACAMYPESLETSLSLGAAVLDGFNTPANDINAIKKEMRSDEALEDAFREYETKWKEFIRSSANDNGIAESVSEEDSHSVIALTKESSTSATKDKEAL